MITLFTIGIIFLVFEMIALAFRATWGLMKAMFWVLGLPFVLVAMLLGGLLHLAMPLLVFGLIIGLFPWAVSMLNGIRVFPGTFSRKLQTRRTCF